MRTTEQLMEAIADSTPEQFASLHKKVELIALSERRKEELHRLFMILELVGQIGKPRCIKH